MFDLLTPTTLSLLLLVPMCLGAVQETDWIEVFRAGDYPQGAFTEADLQTIASRYDADFLEAPVTTDHAQKGPAFGWIEDVKAQGKKLLVKFKDLTDEMAGAINEGLFKNRSVELFNDLQGGPYLKAVSFLGAQTPQVKGLEPIGEIAFSEDQLAAASAAFAYTGKDDENDHAEMDEMGDRLEELMMEQDMSYEELADAMEGDGARAESTLRSIVNGEIEDPPDAVLDSLAGVFDDVTAEALGELRAEQGGAGYSDETGDEDVAELGDMDDVDTMAEMRQEVARMQAELQSERQRAREAEERAEQAKDESQEQAFEQFMEERVPPAIRPRARAIYNALQDAKGHVEFADAAGEDVEDDPVAAYQALLKAFDHEDLFTELADEEPSTENFSNDTSDFTEAVREDMAANGEL